MKNIISIRNLVKRFGEQTAVNGISFDVQEGSFFSFLGQNGAGKSTTINILIGILRADSGEISYGEQAHLEDFKNKIGVVFQDNILDDKLTVEENLLLYGLLNQKSSLAKARLDELIDLFKMEKFKKKRFETLSGGQKRKVELARAVFNAPTILFLDEPTTGLDPKTRKEVWEVLHDIRRTQKLTVFLTTHYMEETADADKVVIIHKGNIICEGSPIELKAKYSLDRLILTPIDAQLLEAALNREGRKYTKNADCYTVLSEDGRDFISLLYNHQQNIKFYEVIKGNMDDVFLNAVGSN